MRLLSSLAQLTFAAYSFVLVSYPGRRTSGGGERGVSGERGANEETNEERAQDERADREGRLGWDAWVERDWGSDLSRHYVLVNVGSARVLQRPVDCAGGLRHRHGEQGKRHGDRVVSRNGSHHGTVQFRDNETSQSEVKVDIIVRSYTSTTRICTSCLLLSLYCLYL